MQLGNPDQGQQQWALINDLVKKEKARAEMEEQEGAQVYGPDLGEFMEVTEENVARNDEEWRRREEERDRLVKGRLIATNIENIMRFQKPVETRPEISSPVPGT